MGGKPSVGRYGDTQPHKPSLAMPSSSSYTHASSALAYSTGYSALSQSTAGRIGVALHREEMPMWLPHVGCFFVMVCFLVGALFILRRAQAKLAQQSQEVQLATLMKAIKAVLDAKVIKTDAPRVKVQLAPKLDVEAAAKHIEEASADRSSSFE